MIELAYGDSDSGKTTGLEQLAKQLIEQTGKNVHVYLGDGGGQSWNAHGLVDAGKIRLFDFSARPWPMTMVKLMADGFWPEDLSDPNSKLKPPPVDEFNTVAMKVYEGASVIGNYLLSDLPGGMAWQAAHQTGFGGVKDENEELSVKDELKGYDDYTLQGAAAPRHYGVIQRKLVSAIRASKKFTGWVFWTAHPTEAPDRTEGGHSGDYGKITGKTIIGPDIGGKALASLISREFGDMLHFDSATIIEKEKDETTQKSLTHIRREYRVYTRRHMDPNQQVLTEYLAVNRCPVPSMMPDHLTSSADNPGDALLQFYSKFREAQTSRERK